MFIKFTIVNIRLSKNKKRRKVEYHFAVGVKVIFQYLKNANNWVLNHNLPWILPVIYRELLSWSNYSWSEMASKKTFWSLIIKSRLMNFAKIANLLWISTLFTDFVWMVKTGLPSTVYYLRGFTWIWTGGCNSKQTRELPVHLHGTKRLEPHLWIQWEHIRQLEIGNLFCYRFTFLYFVCQNFILLIPSVLVSWSLCIFVVSNIVLLWNRLYNIF